jgi:hypothetical protein
MSVQNPEMWLICFNDVSSIYRSYWSCSLIYIITQVQQNNILKII